MPDKERSPVGGILVTIGVIMFAFIVITSMMNLRLGPIGSFLQEYAIIPIALIFAGRAMSRRARRATPAPASVGQPQPKQRRNRLEEFQKWAEEQLEVARPADPAPAPRAPAPAPRTPARKPAPKPREESRPVQSAPVTEEAGLAPLYVPPPKSGTFTPKTSDEMIAEAKRRLETKGRP